MATHHYSNIDVLSRLINLQQYPLDDLDGVEMTRIIADCHQALRQRALCVLPGFLRADTVAQLVEELSTLASQAHQLDQYRTPYGWMDNSGFAQEHPRSALFRTACGVITTDMFAADGTSQAIFQLDELTEFVRRVLDFQSLYRSECPHLSLQVNVLNEGDTFGWHYDTNDGVVSLIVQEADSGGGFEYAPYIRNEDDENYDGVKRLFDAVDSPQMPSMSPGTLTLFLGRRSVHRVAPVGATAKPRLSLLLSYDAQPGMVFPPKTVASILNPVSKPFLGKGV